jgi:uncharacterized damage-inducible protein DinB
MPGTVRPVNDERDGLLTYLAQQRLVIRIAAHGLTDDEARAAPSVSPLSVGGLLKHVGTTERYWIGLVEGRDRGSQDDYENGFLVEPDETVAGLLDRYAEIAAETEAVVRSIDDLGRAVPVPRDAPWYPPDVEAWSVRWVLLHLITETARHAGHADIVRESIDGATAFPLMAAVEGWPPSPWMQAWEPATGSS